MSKQLFTTLEQLGRHFGVLINYNDSKFAPYGVVYHFDKDCGYRSCSFDYEEICAIKEDMERLQKAKK